MPRRPRGEKRPADAIGNAVKVMRIATARKPRNRKSTAPRAPLPSWEVVAARRAVLTNEKRKSIAKKPPLRAGPFERCRQIGCNSHLPYDEFI
jgi:hypothetical protein